MVSGKLDDLPHVALWVTLGVSSIAIGPSDREAVRLGHRDQMPRFRRRDPDRRMARFYAVALQADLLDGWAVVREWGRIGRQCRVRADLHDGLVPALAAPQRVAERKRRGRYR